MRSKLAAWPETRALWEDPQNPLSEDLGILACRAGGRGGACGKSLMRYDDAPFPFRDVPWDLDQQQEKEPRNEVGPSTCVHGGRRRTRTDVVELARRAGRQPALGRPPEQQTEPSKRLGWHLTVDTRGERAEEHATGWQLWESGRYDSSLTAVRVGEPAERDDDEIERYVRKHQVTRGHGHVQQIGWLQEAREEERRLAGRDSPTGVHASRSARRGRMEDG